MHLGMSQETYAASQYCEETKRKQGEAQQNDY
jgi:hypothetical protein